MATDPSQIVPAFGKGVVSRPSVSFHTQRDLFEATLEANRFADTALDWFGAIDIVNFFEIYVFSFLFEWNFEKDVFWAKFFRYANHSSLSSED